MRQITIPIVDQVLRQYSDGLTIPQMELITDRPKSSLKRALLKMNNVYIDRWDVGLNGNYAAVWCLHLPPANCPKPPKRGRKRYER